MTRTFELYPQTGRLCLRMSCTFSTITIARCSSLASLQASSMAPTMSSCSFYSASTSIVEGIGGPPWGSALGGAAR